MYKRIISFALLALPLASTAEIGIGASFDADDSRIYLPYEFSETIRIEPSLRYYKYENDSNIDSDNLEVAVGVFNKRQVAPNMNFLLGLRVGYIDYERSYNGNYSNDSLDGDGYLIAPTLGFEYFISDKFSIGAEVALRYEELEEDAVDSFTDEKYSNDISKTETDTSINVKFYF